MVLKKKERKTFLPRTQSNEVFQCYTWDYIKHYFSNYYFVFASQYVSKDGIHQS